MNRLSQNLLPLLIYCLLIAVAPLCLLSVGCGGGGGGGNNATTIVRGIVLNSADGDRALEGATVTLGGITVQTRTRDNANTNNPVGSFEARNVAVGTQTATITLPQSDIVNIPGQPPQPVQTLVFLPPVGPGVNDNIELIVNIGQVSGRILLPNGQNAGNAFVTVAATGETFETNPDGTFLATLIPYGATELFISQGTASKTQPVNVVYGNTAVGDITLINDPNPNPPGQPFTLFGTVTVTGVGTPAGTVVLLFRNGIQIESTTTDSTGRYRFYVPVGTYTVRAVRGGFQDAETAPISLTDPSNPVQTDLTMVSL